VLHHGFIGSPDHELAGTNVKPLRWHSIAGGSTAHERAQNDGGDDSRSCVIRGIKTSRALQHALDVGRSQGLRTTAGAVPYRRRSPNATSSSARCSRGNRNFEGRIQQEVRANYLASPPLVVAYALAGRIDIDFHNEPLASASTAPCPARHLAFDQGSGRVIARSIKSAMFRKSYAQVFDGDERWRGLPVPEGDRFAWEPTSTYIRRAPYFDGMPAEPGRCATSPAPACCACWPTASPLTTSPPAGSIRKTSPAGQFLVSHGVQPIDFNSYGARRGNHEVMVRDTFANVRLKNLLAPETEGPFTVHLPDGEQMTIYDASIKYAAEGTPLIVLAGRSTARGRHAIGRQGAPAARRARRHRESFERIHRSNLVGMGILPLQFAPGQNPRRSA